MKRILITILTFLTINSFASELEIVPADKIAAEKIPTKLMDLSSEDEIQLSKSVYWRINSQEFFFCRSQ